MEFPQRGVHQNQAAATPGGVGTAPSGKVKRESTSSLIRFTSMTLVFSLAIVLFATVLALVFGGSNNSESKYVSTNSYQAVFLAGGQVYFGQIKSLNSKYLRLQDSYYLRVNQTVQPNQSTSASSNDVSLVKLGCELHGPRDEMLVNRDQVIFWENLKGDGQVAKAVSDYKKANPNGQNCSTNASSTTPTTTTPAKP